MEGCSVVDNSATYVDIRTEGSLHRRHRGFGARVRGERRVGLGIALSHVHISAKELQGSMTSYKIYALLVQYR